jgi:hypothetical protein
LLTEGGVWHELITNKYLHSKSLSQVKVKPSDSPFWKGLMILKDDFLNEVLLELAMERMLVFGRTLGWVTLLYLTNIHRCTQSHK